jgi:hypothetical protein
MSNPQKRSTSHGHSGDTEPNPVPEHKSYGGEKRDEVAGGPAGRGNDATARTVDTGRDWGAAGKQGEEADKAKPVANRPTTKNAFSQ